MSTIRFRFLVVQMIFGLLGFFTSRAGDTNDQISPKLASQTIAWQLHWDAQTRGKVKLPSTIEIKLLSDTSEVFVGELKWVISYGYTESQEYPIYVDRVGRYADDLSNSIVRFSGAPTVIVMLPDYQKTFSKLSVARADTREKILQAFRSQACSKEALSYYIAEDGNRVDQPRFWIAPVNPEFPVLMYYVEGVPYIGKVYFHTKTFKPAYFEFDYISDVQDERLINQKLMRAIRAEGDLFEWNGAALESRRR
jgi:hypothetical protein